MANIAALMTFLSYCFAGTFVLWAGPVSIGLPFLVFCVLAGLWLLMRVQKRTRKEAQAG